MTQIFNNSGTDFNEFWQPSVELRAQTQLKTEREIRKPGRVIRSIVLDRDTRLLALEKNEEND